MPPTAGKLNYKETDHDISLSKVFFTKLNSEMRYL